MNSTKMKTETQPTTPGAEARGSHIAPELCTFHRTLQALDSAKGAIISFQGMYDPCGKNALFKEELDRLSEARADIIRDSLPLESKRAAAPEMFAALARVIAADEPFGRDGHIPSLAERDERAEAMDAARNALAKAQEGGAS